jgi:NADPH-dependent 2,4-dienoyl-CoA reductase/sulfur reductase-like enzyme/rhodanese-related sulfurtransferase
MANRRILVIGGTAAGPKAAAKARRLDPHADITIIQKAPDLSMAACGYPYYVGGVFDDRNSLLSTPTGVVRDPQFFMNAKGIRALTSTEATSIDRDEKTVTIRDLQADETKSLPYDTLILATGARAVKPPIPGIDLEGVSTLKSMRDADYLRHVRDAGEVTEAVVVGGGLIGIETAEGLQRAGMRITIVELLPQILGFLDPELAKLVENHITSHGARVLTNNAVTEFLGENGHLCGVRLKDGTEIPCKLAVIGVGVRPDVELARAAGLNIGERGGIAVNEHLQTSDPAIYACGDCIEIPHCITGQNVAMPLGDLANLQGRVAGQNAVQAGSAVYPGTIQTGICKVFEYTAASTGLSETAAEKAGVQHTVSALYAGLDKPHFMDAKLVILKILADRETGKLLGVQGIGPGDVAKRIAVAATAIHGGLTVGDLASADLPYAPPYSPPIDPIVTAAHVLENQMLGRMDGTSATDVKARLDAGEKLFLLDARSEAEFEQMRLGIGETLIPLGALRRRMDQLPQDKNAPIVCYCKISLRGYEAACLLRGHGYTNVQVMEGGLMAWPFEREK